MLDRFANPADERTCAKSATGRFSRSSIHEISSFGHRRTEARVKSCITTFKNIWTELQGQIYLGSEPFIQNMQKPIEKKARFRYFVIQDLTPLSLRCINPFSTLVTSTLNRMKGKFA